MWTYRHRFDMVLLDLVPHFLQVVRGHPALPVITVLLLNVACCDDSLSRLTLAEDLLKLLDWLSALFHSVFYTRVPVMRILAPIASDRATSHCVCVLL